MSCNFDGPSFSCPAFSVNPFQLCGASLPYTDSYKYLGHIINSVLTHDPDIMKQTGSLYARANIIIRKFSSALLNTKLMLFRAYCTPMAVGYGVQCISILIIQNKQNYQKITRENTFARAYMKSAVVWFTV